MDEWCGPVGRQNGDLYVVASNGSWDGIKNFSETFLKLSPSLSVLDWFTPHWSSLNGVDADLGTTRAMLLPSTTLVIGGGKDGILWVLNRATGQMGHLQGGAGNPPIVETFHATTDLVTSGIDTNGLWDGLAYWSSAPVDRSCTWGSNDVLKSFRLLAGNFTARTGGAGIFNAAISRRCSSGIFECRLRGNRMGFYSQCRHCRWNGLGSPASLRSHDLDGIVEQPSECSSRRCGHVLEVVQLRRW